MLYIKKGYRLQSFLYGNTKFNVGRRSRSFIIIIIIIIGIFKVD